MTKSYQARQKQKLLASAHVDKPHRDKWEFIEKRLGRAMTPDELKDYIGYVNSKGQFKGPRKDWWAVPPGTELSEANGDAMPAELRGQLVRIRIDSKLGRKLLAEEQVFCEKMHRLFPSSYPSDEEIFGLTEKMVNPLAGQTKPLTKERAAEMDLTYHVKSRGEEEAREVTLEEYVNHVGVQNPLPRMFMNGGMTAWIAGPDEEKLV
jgi:hypothetical protein